MLTIINDSALGLVCGRLFAARLVFGRPHRSEETRIEDADSATARGN